MLVLITTAHPILVAHRIRIRIRIHTINLKLTNLRLTLNLKLNLTLTHNHIISTRSTRPNHSRYINHSSISHSLPTREPTNHNRLILNLLFFLKLIQTSRLIPILLNLISILRHLEEYPSIPIHLSTSLNRKKCRRAELRSRRLRRHPSIRHR